MKSIYICIKLNIDTMLRIQEICKEKGITMQQLADKMGITYQALYASLAGNPTIRTLEKIANILNVDIVTLFEKKNQIEICVKYDNELHRITEEDIINIINHKKRNH